MCIHQRKEGTELVSPTACHSATDFPWARGFPSCTSTPMIPLTTAFCKATAVKLAAPYLSASWRPDLVSLKPLLQNTVSRGLPKPWLAWQRLWKGGRGAELPHWGRSRGKGWCLQRPPQEDHQPTGTRLRSLMIKTNTSLIAPLEGHPSWLERGCLVCARVLLGGILVSKAMPNTWALAIPAQMAHMASPDRRCLPPALTQSLML